MLTLIKLLRNCHRPQDLGSLMDKAADALETTMHECNRLQETLEQICESEHKINEVDGLLIHTDLPKYSALEMSQIARKALIENEEALYTQDVNQSMHMTKDFCVDRYDVTLTPVSETKPVAAHEKVDKEALEKAIQTAFYGLNITRDSVVKIIETYESAKRPVGGEVDEVRNITQPSSPFMDAVTVHGKKLWEPEAKRHVGGGVDEETLVRIAGKAYMQSGEDKGYYSAKAMRCAIEAIRPYLRETKE